MALTDIFKTVSEPVVKVTAKVMPKLRKASPEILLGAGILSIGAGAVLACKATLEVKNAIDANLDEVERWKEEPPEPLNGKDSLETMIKKQHLKCVADVCVKYAFPALLMGTGITCIVVSHNIQAKRLVAAVASLDALQLSFEQYRKNVIADQGPSADLRYLTGDQVVKAEFYEEGEDGKVKKVKKEVKVRKGCSDPYVKLFDECNSTEWRKNRGFNIDFIQCQEAFFNRKLRLEGHVFLNEVYEALGFGYDPIGQFTGWILGGEGDDQIVFEVEETYDWEELEIAKEEKRNPEPSFWITFNVDGEIWDKIN